MLTVVMATFEGERFVAEQLGSILSQLDGGDEVIVSDDASTDATVDIIRRCGDRRVRVITNLDRAGYVENFARALAEVRGNYVFFSDQDDVWLPDKVRVMRSALASSACVASDAVVVDERLHELHPSYFKLRKARSFSAFSILLKPLIIGATLACQTSYLQGLLPFPAGVPHDFWITFNAAADGVLDTLQQPLILYRRHGAVASLSATGRRRGVNRIIVERGRLIYSWARRRCAMRML
jgi:glycosyltransferase involved in cell wall biosynthesis